MTVKGDGDAADIGDGYDGSYEKKPNKVNTDGLYTSGSITYSDGTTVYGTVVPPAVEVASISAPAAVETFWGGVLKQLRGAEKGATLTVDAEGRTTMPATIVDAVKECGVTLIIQWDGGDDITIDSSFNKEPTNGVYLLADL